MSPTTGDTLSDLLRAVRLRGAVFFYLEGSSPWVAEAPPASQLIPAVMPGVEHMMEFHAIAKGSCWAAIAGASPVRLEEGDVIMFPQGDAHVVSSAPGMRGRPNKDIFFAPRPPQMPHAIDVGPTDSRSTPVATAHLEGGGRDRATLVCGFLGLDATPFNPLLAALPRALRIPGSTLGRDSWVRTFFNAAVAESNQKRPGGEAVLERMSEMLFVEVLRRYVDTLPAEQTGWLAGMRDESVGRALSLLHGRPAEPWTLERLGEEAGVSRSTMHERFVHFIGQPPMQYLTHWRMQVASRLLRDTNAKLINVALDVGYDSEAAFCRAFKRIVGVTPGVWRRTRSANGTG